MSVAAWSVYDEGYLRGYQWASALAGGAALPQESPPIQLGPGEVAHGHFTGVAVSGFFGESAEYRKSFFLLGGPVGLALTGAASYAHNQSKKREAERAAIPHWHALGTATIVATSQRLVGTGSGRTGSFWYAEMGPMQLTTGPGGVPAVTFQPSGQPILRLDTAFAPQLFVFVHHLVDGRPPAVPLPEGLLERARAQGRLK